MSEPESAMRGSAKAYAAGLFVLSMAASLISYRVYFTGGLSFEFCHYAEIARNLLEGHGVSTQTIYPSYQAQLDAAGHGAGRFLPVLDRFPIQVAWVALFEALFGARDFAVVLAQAVAQALWVAAIFLLGRLFFAQATAFIAALFWAIDPMLSAGFVLHGYADVLFGAVFFVLNALVVLALERPEGDARRERLGWIAIGVVAGAGDLCRYNLVLFLPVYAAVFLCALGRARGLRACVAAAGGLAAIVVPWTIYFFVRTGSAASPLFSTNLSQNVLINGLPWMEYRVYAPADFMTADAVAALGAKWLTLFFRWLEDLPGYWYLAPAWIPAAAWLLTAPRSRARRFAHLCVLLLALQAVLFSFLRYELLGYMNGRYYLWFGPVVLLAAASFLLELRFRIGARRAAWAGALVAALVLLSFCFRYAHIARGNDHPTGSDVGDWPEIRWIAEHTADDDLIVTNIPAQVAWYARRPAMNFTNEPAGMRALMRAHPPAYVYLSATRVGEIDNYPAWRALLRGDSSRLEAFCAEYGFEVAQTFQGGILLRPRR